MRALHNLIVDLDERFSSGADAPSGVRLSESPGLDDASLAWIDDTFGGAWSSEARVAQNVVARAGGRIAGFASFDPQGLRYAWLHGLAQEPGVGVFGPFGVEPELRGRGVGRALLHRALAGLRARGYTRALIAAVGDERGIAYYERACGARVAETFDSVGAFARPTRTLLMASGSGSNAAAVMAAVRAGELPLEIVALLCNVSHARAIERAHDAGIETIVLPWQRGEASRAAYDARLLEAARATSPELVLLLGWMHLLAEPFVRAFPALLNVHPAFLPLDPARDEVGMPDGSVIPAFRGAHAVRDALAAGSGWTGATVHAVTPDVDRGPVLARKPLRIEGVTTEETVLQRLHPIEHVLVAQAVRRWLYERP